MCEGAPDAVRLGTQRITVHNDGRDMQQGAVHVGHVHRKEIEVNCCHMELLLIVDPLLSERLGQSNDHGTAAHTRFVCPDEFLLLDQALGIMHEHLGHGLTHRVRGEVLAALFIMQFEAMVEHAKDIGGFLIQAQREHTEEFRELLERFGRILLHNGKILLFTCGFVDGIGHIAEGDGREFNEMPEGGEKMLAVGELADGVFKNGKVVMPYKDGFR